MAVTVVSLNIERSKHLDTVLPFLRERGADVVCLQEVMEYDLDALSQAAGALAVFSPLCTHDAEGRPGRFGQAIFSRVPVETTDTAWYRRCGEGEAHIEQHDPSTFNNRGFAITYADVRASGASHRIATTHFVWTPDGHPNDLQRALLPTLLETAASIGEHALTGDFNAPRGRGVWETIAASMKDNVPASYTSSIDETKHRAGDLSVLVDGIFTTPAYTVRDFAMRSGVSDHKALYAVVSRV